MMLTFVVIENSVYSDTYTTFEITLNSPGSTNRQVCHLLYSEVGRQHK